MRLRSTIGVLLVATFSFAALAIGTVHLATRAIVFTCCAATLALTLVERIRARKRLAVTVPAVLLAAAAAATALQLIPLPAAVIAWLSPAAGDIFSLGGAYKTHALSLDPTATVSESAKIGAYLAFFVAAACYVSRAHRKRQILVAVAALATVVALIGLAQAAVSAPRVLFLYEPQTNLARWVRGTFVNPNHFGGLLCIGAPCALALALSEPRLRWPAYAATFVMNVAVVLSLARASIAAALIGQALTFGFDQLNLRRGAEPRRSRTATVAMLAAAIVAAVAIAAYAGRSRLGSQLAAVEDDLASPMSKVKVWEQATELMVDYPWTGVGRGAFEPAFTRVSHVGGVVRYQWMENGYLEAIVDWGVPVALLLFLLTAWALKLAVRALRDEPLAIGSLAAMLALAIHEAADFSVELPGVALPALAVAATLFGRPTSISQTGSRRIKVRAVYLALPLALLVPAAAEHFLPSAEVEATRLSAMVRNPGVPTAEILAAGRAAVLRHPADHYIRLVVAERLARERHPESLRWLNDAMYLDPTHPQSHLMAAEVLASTGRKPQSILEYKLAATGAPDPRLVWTYMAARYPKLPDLLAATPESSRYQLLLAKWLVATGRREDAQAVYERGLQRAPSDTRLLAGLATVALDRGDVKAARAAIEVLATQEPTPATTRLRVRERILAGELDAAARLLDALGPDPEALDLELALAQSLAHANRFDDARARLAHVTRRPLIRAAQARVHETAAEIERLAGNEHLYRWELEQRDRLLSPGSRTN